jgi:putative membrane-bound dehydrogenase-like protein
MTRTTTAAALLLAACFTLVADESSRSAQKKDDKPPHGQDTVPGPPLSPAEAIKKMQVPEGFTVELVAAEPDIVNPVAMTFDERGRIWITESLEYPRRDAGPGRDRVKVLESTKGDGRYDKITVFAEGLNIPSGIAVGHGGVWVANAPDILFYKEGPDGKAAGKPEVVVTGFGRTDTHELPNSLTWGPDGWLYGLNGVFNHSRVRQGNKEFNFTCALFRIHPKTREFQLFAEGTSNPWGIAWDNEGSAFVSACVIDHLWHLVETGYYHRQGGPYPPYTWKIESIVQHKHQKAAYCGLHFFDSDAYPPEYREKLYMGNIHGGCINCDELTRDGSTYFGKPRPDFLTANDQWFMPVVQKTGPDGCLYILDWYDRYHCYQDANRDPRGIDRNRGRLYRVRYTPSPHPLPRGGEGGVRGAGLFDLSKESDDQLIQRLHSPNVYFRDLAQRLLCERNTPVLRARLEKLVLDDKEPRKARMHALWALIGTGTLDTSFHLKLLEHDDPSYRAWGVRAAGNMGKIDAELREKVESLARDSSPDVLLQVAIAARKIEGLRPEAVLLQVLSSCGEDKLIPHIVWQNLHPLLEGDGFETLAGHLKRDSLPRESNLARLMPRVFERILAPGADPKGAVLLLQALLGNEEADPEVARQCLATLTTKIQTGEITGNAPARWAQRLRPALTRLLTGKADDPLYWDAALLAATLKDKAGLNIVRPRFVAEDQPETIRLKALEALVAARDESVLDVAGPMLADTKTFSLGFRREVLSALGRLDDAKVAEVVLAQFPKMEPDFQPRAIELLTQRTSWARLLLRAVAEKKVPAGALSVNHVRKLLASKDAAIIKQVKEQWGTLREDRNPEREKIVADMKKLLAGKKGNPAAGQIVFKNVCAQCHTIYGEGQDVGPDITLNGRNDYDQLLSNVFDPSLVIGAAYQATTVATTQGRVLTGILVEDNAQRVVLKTQGGKLETIPRGEIDEIQVSRVSLMPEGIEKQLQEQEIIDLFAFLTLDKPPSDPTARKIPGAPK